MALFSNLIGGVKQIVANSGVIKAKSQRQIETGVKVMQKTGVDKMTLSWEKQKAKVQKDVLRLEQKNKQAEYRFYINLSKTFTTSMDGVVKNMSVMSREIKKVKVYLHDALPKIGKGIFSAFVMLQNLIGVKGLKLFDPNKLKSMGKSVQRERKESVSTRVISGKKSADSEREKRVNERYEKMYGKKPGDKDSGVKKLGTIGAIAATVGAVMGIYQKKEGVKGIKGAMFKPGERKPGVERKTTAGSLFAPNSNDAQGPLVQGFMQALMVGGIIKGFIDKILKSLGLEDIVVYLKQILDFAKLIYDAIAGFVQSIAHEIRYALDIDYRNKYDEKVAKHVETQQIKDESWKFKGLQVKMEAYSGSDINVIEQDFYNAVSKSKDLITLYNTGLKGIEEELKKNPTGEDKFILEKAKENTEKKIKELMGAPSILLNEAMSDVIAAGKGNALGKYGAYRFGKIQQGIAPENIMTGEDYVKMDKEINEKLGINKPENKQKGLVPAKAYGGVVKAKSGGSLNLLGEGGMNEAVVPLPDGKSIPIQVMNPYMLSDSKLLVRKDMDLTGKMQSQVSESIDRMSETINNVNNQNNMSQTSIVNKNGSMVFSGKSTIDSLLDSILLRGGIV
jgi:hypothetical protein